MSSLCQGKRLLRLNRPWKSFAKFSKATKKTSQRLNRAWKSLTKFSKTAKKTSQRITILLSSLSPSVNHENRMSISPPCSYITSLYEYPCSNHCSLCKQLRDNLPEEPVMVHDRPYGESSNAMDILASVSLLDDDAETEEEEEEAEDENVGEKGIQYLDEKAELYIKHF